MCRCSVCARAVCALLVLFSTFTLHAGSIWSDPVYLNPNDSAEWDQDFGVRIESDRNGTCIAAWAEKSTTYNAHVVVARSADSGASWQHIGNFDTGATQPYYRDDMNPTVHTDGKGTWIVSWMGVNQMLGDEFGGERDLFFTRSTNNGLTWTPPALLNANGLTDTGADQDGAVELATDSEGNWVAVWLVLAAGDYDIKYACSSDNGQTWSWPRILNPDATETAPDLYPFVRTDKQGNWLVVWNTRNTYGELDPGVHLVCARSTDLGASWSAPIVIDPDTDLTTAYNVHCELDCDAQGNWVAICDVNRQLSPTVRKYDILTWRSTDAGLTWSAPTAVDSITTEKPDWKACPRIGSDRAGNWLAMWYAYSAPDGTRAAPGTAFMLASNSTNNGQQWCPPEIVGQGFYVDLKFAGNGRWIAAFQTKLTGIIPGTEMPDSSDTDLWFVSGEDVTPCSSAPVADLAVSKFHSPEPATIGEPVGWTVTVENKGPAAATNVTVTDTLPPGVSFLFASAEGGDISTSGSEVICRFASMDTGDTKTIEIVGLAEIVGEAVNTVSVAGNESDPDTSNNTATDTVTIEDIIEHGPDLTGDWISLTQLCKERLAKIPKMVTLRSRRAARRAPQRMVQRMVTTRVTQCLLKGSIDVTNIGDLAAGASRLRFYLSDDEVYSPDDMLLMELHDLGNMNPQETKTRNLNVTLQDNTSATGKYVIAIIDTDDEVDEIDETNNSIVYGPIP